MARGAEAKEKIARKLAKAFGEDWIGEYEKKYYVWSNEGGERIQVAISMTCPKVPIEVASQVDTSGDWDWGDSTKAQSIAVNNVAPAEITDEELNNVKVLLERLGL